MSVLDLIETQVAVDFSMIDSQEDLPSDEEMSQQRAHRERVKHCGQTFALRPNPLTGLWSRVRYYCGYVRECPICRERKAEKVRQELLAGGVAGLYVKVCDEEEAKALCELVGTENYRRFPMEDGYTIVYRDPEELVGGQSWSDSNIDLYELVVAPEHKRVTGKLGKKPTAKKDITLKLKSFVAPKVTLAEWEQITKKVFKLTQHFNPTTGETLQRALENRAGLVEDRLKELGKHYWTQTTKEGVNVAEIRWAKEYRSIAYDEE
jgi:hypothetical protein